MRAHNGMRPQDVPVLLKIIALGNQDWQVQQLSNTLHISIGEISTSLDRSRAAGLVDFRKKRANRQAILEFLIHGVKYVFPQSPGAITKGVPTAHAHPAMKEFIQSDVQYVWPYKHGSVIGEQVLPFYEKQPDAAMEDPIFYKLLALVDTIRVGQSRERNIAIKELERELK